MNTKAQSKLAQRFATIEQRLAALEAQLNPPARALAPAGLGFGPARDNKGDVIPDPNLPSYQARMRERRDAEARSAAAERAERAANHGCYKDPMGCWRDGEGRQLPDAQAREMEARAQARARGEAAPDGAEPNAMKRLPADVRAAVDRQFKEPGYISPRRKGASK